jgi:DNA-binding MarR family transcriptional regulator
VTVTTRADLEHLLSAVAHRVTRRLSAVLDAQGSSLEEWRVLTLLVTHDGQSMSVIASFSMLPAPTLTKLIDRMVAANLVYRRRDEQDRRRVLVHLAPHGRALFTRLQGLIRDEQARRDAAVAEVVDPADLSRLLADVLAQLD